MEILKNYDQVSEKINENKALLLYGGDPFCIVCQDTKPLVETLAKDLNLPIYYINIAENDMARGQLNLFTAPVVMFFVDGREAFRQGRFLDLEEMKFRLENYLEI